MRIEPANLPRTNQGDGRHRAYGIFSRGGLIGQQGWSVQHRPYGFIFSFSRTTDVAMFGRTLILAMGLAAAAGVPYAINRSKGLRERAESLLARQQDATVETEPGDRRSGGRDRPRATGKIDRPAGPPVHDFSEIFRFDIDTAWVLGRWPRVTTQLADVELQGYRVPLVTGSREDDLAGSLTYFFGRQHKLQRISFFGTTGDARRLVAMLESRFEFQRELDADPGLFLYQVKWNGKPDSELRIRAADVVTSTQSHRRFEVALVIQRPRSLNRPSSYRGWFGDGDRRAAPRPADDVPAAPHAQTPFSRATRVPITPRANSATVVPRTVGTPPASFGQRSTAALPGPTTLQEAKKSTPFSETWLGRHLRWPFSSQPTSDPRNGISPAAP